MHTCAIHSKLVKRMWMIVFVCGFVFINLQNDSWNSFFFFLCLFLCVLIKNNKTKCGYFSNLFVYICIATERNICNLCNLMKSTDWWIKKMWWSKQLGSVSNNLCKIKNSQKSKIIKFSSFSSGNRDRIKLIMNSDNNYL